MTFEPETLNVSDGLNGALRQSSARAPRLNGLNGLNPRRKRRALVYGYQFAVAVFDRLAGHLHARLRGEHESIA